MPYIDLELGLCKKHDYTHINQSNSLYNIIDHEKTQALIKTMKNIDKERRLGPL